MHAGTHFIMERTRLGNNVRPSIFLKLLSLQDERRAAEVGREEEERRRRRGAEEEKLRMKAAIEQEEHQAARREAVRLARQQEAQVRSHEEEDQNRALLGVLHYHRGISSKIAASTVMPPDGLFGPYHKLDFGASVVRGHPW